MAGCQRVLEGRGGRCLSHLFDLRAWRGSYDGNLPPARPDAQGARRTRHVLQDGMGASPRPLRADIASEGQAGGGLVLHNACLRSSMGKARTSGAQLGRCVGNGRMAAPGATGLLSLSAAPVFALMALWTGLFGQPDMLCMSMHNTSSLNGMALMYTLMSIFHAAPWMKLISSRWIDAAGPNHLCGHLSGQ